MAKLAAMVERRGHDRSIQFEHAFDRLLAVKLGQVYGILVPEQFRAIGTEPRVRGKSDEGRRDLRQGIFRTAEGGEDDRQSDSVVAGVCPQPLILGPLVMGIRGRRIQRRHAEAAGAGATA